MNIKYLTCLIFGAVFALTACSDDPSETEKISEFAKTPHVVSGKVEKGPMVYGSTVEMRTLDSDLSATGNSYTSSIGNNVGDFDFGSLKISSPYAKLTADGYFFNEVTGKLSVSTIKLDAIVDLSDNSTVNVNILTHLKSKRITQLVTKDKKTYAQANKQAQEELMKQFGLQQYASNDATVLSIAQGDQRAGCLIAVSTLVIAERSEAEIVEFLSKLTNEFGANGEFSESSKKALYESLVSINDKLDDVNSNIRQRYADLGYEIEVPDLQFYYDWDKDGIAGNEFDTSGNAPIDISSIDIPVEGGTYKVTIQNGYYLEAPIEDEEPSVIISDGFFSDLYAGGYTYPSIDYTKELSGNTLTIIVSPNQYRPAVTGIINIYDARSRVVANIELKQAGNKSGTSGVNVPKLGDYGKAAVRGMASYLGCSVSGILSIQDALNQSSSYTGAASLNNVDNELYRAINVIKTIRDADSERLDVYGPYLDTYQALAYLTRASYWGGVVIGATIENIPPATMEDDVYNIIIPNLKNALPDLEEKANSTHKDENDILFVSKNVARAILAQAYCGKKDWNNALSYLNEIIETGHYELTGNNFSILPLNFTDDYTGEIGTNYILRYEDVLLMKAECLAMQNKEAEALSMAKQVADVNNITLGSDNALTEIGKVRVKLNMPFTLPYLRRHDLSKSVTGIDVQWINQLVR